ncbi:MAG: fibrillarin-like rRNA/tRNA 2'-O-methyltransferase [Candidatus Aenigmatarchaeota archaeon]
MKEIFCGVFLSSNEKEKKLYTINLVPGASVYGEALIEIEKKEYREWNPTRSKLAAAILNNLRGVPIKARDKVLYLGTSTGTTCSHISDIIGRRGIIYGIEYSQRVIYPLLGLAEKRKNIVPILADARKPEKYYWVEEVNVLYCDIAQPDEVDIAIRNASAFLKNRGYMMIAIKARSIDVTKEPSQIYKQEAEKLRNSNFEIIDMVNLEPYEQSHCMVLARR